MMCTRERFPYGRAQYRLATAQRNQTAVNGFHREDGGVGAANYWLVIPMVFCQNRNIQVLQKALLEPLGYARQNTYQLMAQMLMDGIKNGNGINEVFKAIIDVCANRLKTIAISNGSIKKN